MLPVPGILGDDNGGMARGAGEDVLLVETYLLTRCAPI